MTSDSPPLFRQLTRAVFAAQSSVLRYGDRANAEFGQSSARWRVMFNIAQGNGTVAGIARETQYARQSIQRVADTLVADGLATYSPNPADRRTQFITLTAEGETLLAEMEASFEHWSSRLTGKFGRENVQRLIEDLHQLKQVLDADAEQFP